MRLLIPGCVGNFVDCWNLASIVSIILVVVGGGGGGGECPWTPTHTCN